MFGGYLGRRAKRGFPRGEAGNVAVVAAVTLPLLLLGVGAAVDLSRVTASKRESQDRADAAVLAAALHMTRSATSGDAEGKRQQEAKSAAAAILDPYLAEGFEKTRYTIRFENGVVHLDLEAASDPTMMHMFGVGALRHSVVSEANIASVTALDIDIALISDATGSMQTTLDAIQDNMRGFATDLELELLGRGIEPGNVRVKFGFYRDYMIDGHYDWSGNDTTPTSALQYSGPMYMSRFYDLPGERDSMDAYVDGFTAHGGGSKAESGLEAIWYALDDPAWKPGHSTVRAIVLWTDAPNRSFYNYTESELVPGHAYWDPVLENTIGSFFTAYSHAQRETYMRDTFYPTDVPADLQGLRTAFSAFHTANANGFDDVDTLTVNVMGNCLGVSPCGDWPTMGAWDGVTYKLTSDVNVSTETYDAIVKQVADTVETQAVVKNLALSK